EVGQAGRIALPNPIQSAAVGGFDPTTITDCFPVAGVQLTSPVGGADPTEGLWYDAATNSTLLMTWLDGDKAETVRLNGLNTRAKTIDGCFWKTHIANAPVVVRGAFGNGILAPSPPSPLPNGSDATHLKLFGDINGDGRMRYIEYICDNGDIPGRPDPIATHNLYRNDMAWDTLPAAKPAVNNSMILLSNVFPNPPDQNGNPRPCFQYQYPNPTLIPVQGVQTTFVIDVAVTLTVQTQSVDPVTKQFQTETKALLNVSPRNVFFAWELASIGYTDHVQSTPASVTQLT